MWLLYSILLACRLQQPPDISVPVVDIELDRDLGVSFYEGKPFSGYAIEHYPNQQKKEQTPYIHGKKHGTQNRWFLDGTLAAETIYLNGRRNGPAKTWWKDGTLRTHSQFINGVGHGVQKQWFRTGELFKEINLNMGKEEGLQRAWRENGDIYNNYEAKDNRTYGLKRSKLCFQLEEEDVVRSD